MSSGIGGGHHQSMAGSNFGSAGVGSNHGAAHGKSIGPDSSSNIGGVMGMQKEQAEVVEQLLNEWITMYHQSSSSSLSAPNILNSSQHLQNLSRFIGIAFYYLFFMSEQKFDIIITLKKIFHNTLS